MPRFILHNTGYSINVEDTFKRIVLFSCVYNQKYFYGLDSTAPKTVSINEAFEMATQVLKRASE